MNFPVSVVTLVAWICIVWLGFSSSIPETTAEPYDYEADYYWSIFYTQHAEPHDHKTDYGRLCNQRFEYFYNQTQMCYLVPEYDSQGGPCGGNMSLYAISSQYATCKCGDIFTCYPKRLIYYREDNRCLNSYEQGPCGVDEWLVPDGDSGSKCEFNFCKGWVSPEKRVAGFEDEFDSFTFAHNGRCYRSFTRGFCDPPNVVYMLSPKSGPRCWDPYPHCGMSGTAYTKRSNGHERDQFGGCPPRARQADYE